MAAGKQTGGRLLIGVKAIVDHYRISNYQFYMLAGIPKFPARKINNQWWAWTDNLDAFFAVFTIGPPLNFKDDNCMESEDI